MSVHMNIHLDVHMNIFENVNVVFYITVYFVNFHQKVYLHSHINHIM